MASSCAKCSQLSASAQLLMCGHFICKNCLPVWNHSHEIIVACPTCSIMTLLSNDEDVIEADPQNFVICIECRSDVMSTRTFLDSIHRKHDVTSVAKIVCEVQKSLRKYQLSLDLQNQALYSQVQSLSKQKRVLSEQYSRKIIQMRYQFDQLKNAVQSCEQSCMQTYQNIILQVVSSFDSKIKDIKNSILKCQSYIECIDHNLVKSNYCKHVASTQFYFQQSHYFDHFLNQLISQRKNNITSIPKSTNIKSANLNSIKQLSKKVKNLSIWETQSKKQIQIQKIKQNPQNEIQKYFEGKRKQILSNREFNDRDKDENRSTENKQSRAVQNSHLVKDQRPSMDSYNIQGRIQNLRRTLKLGDRGNQPKTNFGITIK